MDDIQNTSLARRSDRDKRNKIIDHLFEVVSSANYVALEIIDNRRIYLKFYYQNSSTSEKILLTEGSCDIIGLRKYLITTSNFNSLLLLLRKKIIVDGSKISNIDNIDFIPYLKDYLIGFKEFNFSKNQSKFIYIYKNLYLS